MKRFHSFCRTGAWTVWLLFARGAVAAPIALPPQTPANEVTISTRVPTAYAAAGTAGSFAIQRLGSTQDDVTIHYQVSGRALAGQDYVALKGARRIAAGKTLALVTVHPLAVAGGGGTVKGVRMTLVPGDGYALGATVKATVKIVQ